MKRQSYQVFWDRIHNLAKRENFPLRVMFELTYSCNFKCSHCYIPKSYVGEYEAKELKTKEVFAVLDQLKNTGCFYLGFTGGEPLLRNDAIDILRYARELGFQVILYTNGSLINNKKAAILAKLRVNKVDITLPALTRSNFSAITGVGGFREKVLESARILKEHKVNIGFKTCLLKENENELKQIDKFAVSLGGVCRIGKLVNPHWGEFRESRGTFGSYRKVKCGSAITQAAITPAGELKPCVMVDYPKYNIFENSLDKCWDKLKKTGCSLDRRCPV
jgi:MoaA/NifB/PqqE/SkfB family radical SAM enzyme